MADVNSWALAAILRSAVVAIAPLLAAGVVVQAARGDDAGFVCNVKVVSDAVEDVSSVEAWKAAVLKPGMTDEEKALAVWETVVKFRHQNSPPKEFLHTDDGDFCVHDAIKTFNVYGYGMCCCAASNVKTLARAAGLPVRGRALHGHSLPEVFYDGGWHMLDASFVNYFRGAGGAIAGFDEIFDSVSAWYQMNREMRGKREKLQEFMRDGGWRNGPAIFAATDFLGEDGMLPAGTHGWHSLMSVYDGAVNHPYEFGYSQGYRVNVRLRPGEVLRRNWSNRGLHVNMAGGGGKPGSIDGEVGKGDLRYAGDYGDLGPGRIGNGTRSWDVPLSGDVLEKCALVFEDLAPGDPPQPALCAASSDKPGVFVLDMPSSYVYLGGRLRLGYTLQPGGALRGYLSRNNGADWAEIYAKTGSGEYEERVDLTPLVYRLYDYQLRFEFEGQGSGFNMLTLTHDIQHSQRALPALGPGENTITFSAEPADEGTVTIEGLPQPERNHDQLNALDFHPALSGVECTGKGFELSENGGTVTFSVETPGDMARLRFGCLALNGTAEDGWDFLVSFDGGGTWKKAGRAGGNIPGISEYVTFSDVPAGAKNALVRFAGTRAGGSIMVQFRIDADYREPHGGFRPVRVTYTWDEGGQRKRHVYVAKRPRETYTIECAGKPVMKSLLLEPVE